MATAERWERPSPRVRELLRSAAQQMLDAPEADFDQLDAVTLASADPAVREDPALVAAIRRTNRANLRHWLRANVQDPGARVAPNLGPEVFVVSRDLVRRGLDQTSLDAYRVGQNIAWRLWMAHAFTLTTDHRELAELLDASARSIFDFVDRTLAGIADAVQREREALTRGTQAERLEVVTLVLRGAPIAASQASLRLGYELDRAHTASVIFGDALETDQAALEEAAELVARTAGARRSLTVLAGGSVLWAWTAGTGGPDLGAVRAGLARTPGTRIAVGPTLRGVDGFRRSHHQALVAQRLLLRAHGAAQVASYDEVQAVALATQDEHLADELVQRALGPLATAPAELRETLRTYLRERCNATRTAQLLFAHRNTVLNRLERAEQLLPAPLAGRTLEVGLALEIVHWLGVRDAPRAGVPTVP